MLNRFFSRISPGSSTQNYQLIVGLGNNGDKFSQTRHNCGFLAVDWLASYFKLSWRHESKLNSYLAKSQEHQIILAKPTTMMNLSGQAVYKLAHYYKINQDNIIVIHDDADLEFGAIKLAENTQSGAGHHGVMSVISYIKSGFKRIRIGIGRPAQPVRDISDYVLGRLTKPEIETLNNNFEQIISLIKK